MHHLAFFTVENLCYTLLLFSVNALIYGHFYPWIPSHLLSLTSFAQRCNFGRCWMHA